MNVNANDCDYECDGTLDDKIKLTENNTDVGWACHGASEEGVSNFC